MFRCQGAERNIRWGFDCNYATLQTLDLTIPFSGQVAA